MIETSIPGYYPRTPTTADHPRCIQIIPSAEEQMGVDPISKLAAAIEKLAEALREIGR